MDAAEIAAMVRDLKLSKETDGDGVVITKEEERRGSERLAKTVVGKIFARRPANKEIIKTHIPRILRARGGMEIEMIGYNIFAISFALVSDKRVALEDGPWHFFQDLMIIKETDLMQSVAELEFNEISMWIQCHNVPMACMDPEILEKVGSKVGHVDEIDLDEGGITIGKTIRMRIRRKLETPLVRCVPVTSEKSTEETIVIIQYEKLPHFCFACGRVGHIIKDYEDDSVDKKTLRYDHRLRAALMLNPQNSRFWGGEVNRGWGEKIGKREEVRQEETRLVLREETGTENEGEGPVKEAALVLGENEGAVSERELWRGERMEEDEEQEVERNLRVEEGGTKEGEVVEVGQGLISPSKKRRKGAVEVGRSGRESPYR